MTHDPESEPATAVGSLLPPPPTDICDMRVTRAQLAKFVGCSKQTTSQWARKGIVTFSAVDDRANLGDALRQVMERTDPHKLRVRAFRELVHEHDQLRARIAELQRQLAAEHAQHQGALVALTNQFRDDQAVQLATLLDLMEQRFDALASARASGTLADALDDLSASVFYPEAAATGATEPQPDDPPATSEEANDEA